MSAFAAKGFEARAVGGCVRNALLGVAVSDIDIATPVLPDEVAALAREAGFGVVPTGLAHGTLTVIAEHVPFEVTTLRRDIETFGRHATVAFTEDWADDARRRDFTMNALYAGADGTVYDPLGGFADLLAGRVRFIGDPRERIREDYLRILRFFRFSAVFGRGALDRPGLGACVIERQGLALLSAERVRSELLKLLAAPFAWRSLEAMYDNGLLGAVLGAAPHMRRLASLIDVEAELARPADPILRLTAVAIAVAEDVDRVASRLRLSNDERDGMRIAARAIGTDVSERALRRAIYRDGNRAVARQLLLKAAALRMDGPAQSATQLALQSLVGLASQWQAPVLPVSGRDVIHLGVAAGPVVGNVLRAVEDWWIGADFPDRDRVLQELVSLVSAAGGR